MEKLVIITYGITVKPLNEHPELQELLNEGYTIKAFQELAHKFGNSVGFAIHLVKP